MRQVLLVVVDRPWVYRGYLDKSSRNAVHAEAGSCEVTCWIRVEAGDRPKVSTRLLLLRLGQRETWTTSPWRIVKTSFLVQVVSVNGETVEGRTVQTDFDSCWLDKKKVVSTCHDVCVYRWPQ